MQAIMHNNVSRKSCTSSAHASPFGSEMSNSTLHCVSDDDVSLSSAADLDKELHNSQLLGSCNHAMY